MEWSTNIIKADRDSKPDIDPRDGLLYTQAPLELMRMITQQVPRIVLFASANRCQRARWLPHSHLDHATGGSNCRV